MMLNSKLVMCGLVAGALALSGCHKKEPEPMPTPSRARAAGASTAPVDPALASRGETLWRNRSCDACHSIGHGKRAGPDLKGVTYRRTHEWLVKWLKNTEEMLQTDPIAQQMLAEYHGYKMTNMKLQDAEVEALIAYLQQQSEMTN